MWDKAKQQKDKLLNQFEYNIIPSLKEYYNITGEDYRIPIQQEGYKLYLIFRHGNLIEYEIDEVADLNSPILKGSLYYSLEHSMMLDYDSMILRGYNMKVIRYFVEYWNKILEYMNERVKVCELGYTKLLGIDTKGD